MAETKKFDIAVIGAGPGGYVAAIKAAQNKKKVALIEKGLIGGTCLNVGCIPTKTLIAHADVMHKIQHAADFGITTGPVSFDFAKMKERKDNVIEKMRKSLTGLIQSNGIEIIQGTAEFTSPKELKVKGENSCFVQADKIIIASGSEPLDIGAFPCDHQVIFNSTSILEMTELPKTLAIVGGGYIGCEFASLYAHLGVKVTILEALPAIVSLQGKTISDAFTASCKKKGIDIRTSVFVEGIDKTGSGASVRLRGLPPVECEKVLVAVGRKIVSAGLGLEKAGVQLSDKGAILVNERMETNVPDIYAIGDVTGKFLLAHVASHQGVVAAANATGQEASMHYDAVPAVIFTMPEIATVGKTLEEALAAGLPAKSGRFPFAALGKAVATQESDGFAEVVVDSKTGAIIGAQVVGHDASSLIAEMALAINNELTVDCLTETIHAHPTLPEAWLEASLMAVETPIHFPPKIRR